MRNSKNKYYSLVAGLPDISLNANKLPFTSVEFKQLLEDQLKAEDYELIKFIFLKIDNQNVLSLLKKEDKFTEGGNYTKDIIEAEIHKPVYIDDYLIEFIEAYKTNVPLYQNLSWENQLTTLYYEHIAAQTPNEFLGKWFKFELDLNNIISGINCRNYDYEIKEQLIGQNDVNESIIKRNPVRDFGLMKEYPFLENLLYLYDYSNIFDREQKIDEYKWQFLDENETFFYFTIEKIISYLIKLQILERWQALDEEAGQKQFDTIIKNLSEKYTVPEQF